MFDATATSGDIVTIDDSVNVAVDFEFGTDPGEILVGIDADASAANLVAAIEAAVLAGTLDVTVSAVGPIVTIANHADFTGGSIVETADPGVDMTIVDFAGGVAGIVPGADEFEAATNLGAAIVADGTINVDVVVDGRVVYVINLEPGVGVLAGVLAETTDIGAAITTEDFALATPSLEFWAFVAPVL